MNYVKVPLVCGAILRKRGSITKMAPQGVLYIITRYKVFCLRNKVPYGAIYVVVLNQLRYKNLLCINNDI